jgi:hypothetical protein
MFNFFNSRKIKRNRNEKDVILGILKSHFNTKNIYINGDMKIILNKIIKIYIAIKEQKGDGAVIIKTGKTNPISIYFNNGRVEIDA